MTACVAKIIVPHPTERIGVDCDATRDRSMVLGVGLNDVLEVGKPLGVYRSETANQTLTFKRWRDYGKKWSTHFTRSGGTAYQTNSNAPSA